MKSFLAFLILISLCLSVRAQDPAIMEKKAKELYRIIGLSDKDQWLRFVNENYTPAFIARPLTARISTNGDVTTINDASKTASNAEEKAKLLARLHDDFGKSKLVSIKTEKEKLKMVLNSENGLTGTFDLLFDKNNMIDRFGVMAER